MAYGSTTKTIKTRLSEKVNKWANSITDETVKKAVLKDAMVMGGSIASMLLGDDVNDYDVYFRTPETVDLVAKYYLGVYEEKSGNCGGAMAVHDSVSNIKGDVERRIYIEVPSEGVLGVNPDDENLSLPVNDPESYQPVFISQNAITLSDQIQLITRFYGEPDEVLKNFDFSHAKNVYVHDGKKVILNDLALECLLSKTLHYEGSLYPIASVWRMKKFIDRGFRISAGQQLKIMWQISELDLSDLDLLRDQLVGVDSVYLADLIRHLSEKNSAVDSTYVGNLIDRLFV